MKTRAKGIVVELKSYDLTPNADLYKMRMVVYVNGVVISSGDVIVDEDSFEPMLSQGLKHAKQQIVGNKKRCDAVGWDIDKILEMKVK